MTTLSDMSAYGVSERIVSLIGKESVHFGKCNRSIYFNHKSFIWRANGSYCDLCSRFTMERKTTGKFFEDLNRRDVLCDECHVCMVPREISALIPPPQRRA